VRAVSIIHRLGRLEIGETSVLVVVAAAHRGAAFDACRWVIDMLKKRCRSGRKNTLKMARSGPTERHFPKKSGGREARRGRRAHLKLLLKHFSH